jgi:hypothetical protein
MHHNIPLGIVSAQIAAYLIEQSLLFDGAARLSRTPSVAGNLKTWTFSAWVKYTADGTTQQLFTAIQSDGNTANTINFLSTGALFVAEYNSGYNYELVTSALFKDPSAWYHIVVALDTTQATASDRLKIYVNGVQITAFSTSSYPSLNFSTSIGFNTTSTHRLGSDETSGYHANHFEGLVSLPILVDGAALDPTSFGEEDDDGYWNPIEFAGTTTVHEEAIALASTGTNIGNATNNGGLAAAFDGVVNTSDTCANATGVTLYVGKDWGSGVTKTISSFFMSSPSNDGWSGASPVTIRLEGSSDNFSSDVNTLHEITGITFGASTVTQTVNWVTTQTTAYRYHRWVITGASGGSRSVGEITCNELISVADSYGTNGGAYDFADSSNFGLDVSGGATDTGVVLFQSNFDGSDAATTATDASPYARAITFNGSAELDTSAYKYGTASLQVPGVASTHYVSVPDSDDFDFSATDFTIEAWVRFDTLSVDHIIFSQEADANNYFWLGYQHTVWGFFAQGKIAGAGGAFGHNSLSGYAINTWYHIALVKQGGTVYVYRDGVSLASSTVPVYGNIAADWRIGGNGVDPSFQGRIDDVRITKGVARYPNGTTFTVPASAHAAPSINTIISNSFYSSGFATTDQLADTPTDSADDEIGNYATLNRNDRLTLYATPTFSEGNLAMGGAGNNCDTRATHAVSSGKHYFEMKVTVYSGGIKVGVTKDSDPMNTTAPANQRIYYIAGTKKAGTGTLTAYGASYTTNDIIGVAVDLDVGEIEFFKNNVSQGVAFTDLTVGDAYMPLVDTNNGGAILMDFGQRGFTYTPPAGYQALATQNMPAPTIADGSDYFNTVLYTGNAADRTIDVGFQPDMIWIKPRTAATSPNHQIFDSVRGAAKLLYPNLTYAEDNLPPSWADFTSNGFFASAGGGLNQNSQDFVAWCWKAGGAAVTNTVGSITSSVSANPTSGFSIATYTGIGSSGTVGHGLGAAPKFIIIKSRSNASTNWRVYHDGLGGITKYLLLNSSAAVGTASMWGTPGTTAFTIGGATYEVNETGQTYVAYCWAEVEGFSKFSSYIGNGSTNGPFVYCGFRPAFVIVKCTGYDGSRHWNVFDTVRGDALKGGNPVYGELHANQSSAESLGFRFDILSNGFKLRDSGADVNASTYTYIYAAFAENPFQGGTADSSSQGRAR